MANYYELYPGSKHGGEVAIETDVEPDDYGCILLTEEQYSAGFRTNCRERRGRDDYHEDYDVSVYNGHCALFPQEMGFDHPHVEQLLDGKVIK